MSAREIIAKWIWGYADREGRVDNILSDLTAAGYRLLAPGDLDAETVERCALLLERQPSFGDGKWAARHVRSLTPGSMEGKE